MSKTNFSLFRFLFRNFQQIDVTDVFAVVFGEDFMGLIIFPFYVFVIRLEVSNANNF
jgi:hypothetical protein